MAMTLPSLRSDLRLMLGLFARPQPVTLPIVLLFSIIPFYLVIGEVVSGALLHAPELALDRALPVQPGWSVIYLSLYLAALLPVFVVHQPELIRRTVLAFLSAWLVAYAFFLAYPTVAPTRVAVVGDGFFDWMLRTIHAADIDYNCFPSLHVAQCVLAALVCHRVHRGVGVVAGVWALLVGLSTLFTKQHYIADVVAGAVLAWLVALVYLRGYPREATPALERRLAPLLALAAVAVYGVIVAMLYLAYALDVEI